MTDSRAEKERNSVQQELEENQLLLQQDNQDRANLEKNGKMIGGQISDLQCRLDDLQRMLNEADGAKRKLVVENCDLQHHLEEGDRTAIRLSKDKTSLSTQLDDTKRLADAESRERINLLGKMKNLEHELELMREQLDEEYDAKQDLERQLSKALADANLWKTRYETEGLARIEEIDRDKGKVAARLAEAEETISALHEKLANLEKTKVKLTGELDEVSYI